MGEPPDLTPTFITTPKGEELVIMSRELFDRLASAGHRRSGGVGTNDRTVFGSAPGRAMIAEPLHRRANDFNPDADDDQADADIARRAREEWTAAGRPVVPLAVVRRIRAGDSRLRAFRLDRGMGQPELAEKAGIAQGYLSEIERGLKSPNAGVLAKLAAALDTHPTCLEDAAGASEPDLSEAR